MEATKEEKKKKKKKKPNKRALASMRTTPATVTVDL
jgi:hypothetical protein